MWLPNFPELHTQLYSRRFQILLLIIIGLSSSLIAQNEYMEQWPQFRGPFACGIIDSADLPDTWDVITGENIRW